MEILDDLIQIRKEKKIGQKEIAGALRVNTTTMSRYENGERNIRLPELLKYAEYLGYEIRLLIKK